MAKIRTNKLRVLIVTGTRAEYGLLEPLMVQMLKNKHFQPKFLVTGMHTLRAFGQTTKEIEEKKYPIAATIPIGKNDDMIQSLGKEIAGIGKYFSKNLTDFVIVLGDRDEPLAAVIAANHFKIPVAHISGGEVSGMNVDEFNRHAITKYSHFHFVSCKENGIRVKNLGEEEWRIFNVGAIGLDGLSKIKYPPKSELGKKLGLDPKKKWILVIHHPTHLDETPLDAQVKPLFRALSHVSRSNADAEILVIYPNSDNGNDIFIKEIEEYRSKANFHIVKTLPRNEYLAALNHFDLLIGNSSSGIIESTFYKIPTINIGNRQNGRASGKNVLNSSYDEKSISAAINKALSPEFKKICLEAKSPYGSGQVIQKIIKTIEFFASKIKNDIDSIFWKKPPRGYEK